MRSISRIVLSLLGIIILNFAMPSQAAIKAGPTEVNAVKALRSIFQLEELKAYLRAFQALGPVTVDLNESIKLLEQTRKELIANLPELLNEETARGSAANASFAIGLIVADLKTLELELMSKGPINPSVRARLDEVYELYQELSR